MPTEVITDIPILRDRIQRARAGGLRVGCVPTMGAFHAGHAALFDRARADCDLLVATLFVNPLQFDRADDLARYPRDIDADLRTCGDHGVDMLFAPPVDAMYPRPIVTTIQIDGLASTLCGASRPGHFQGVAIVVLKLLNIVQADYVCFGEKDYQQLAIIRRLVEDMNVPVRIVGVETVREPDGLALSSRNLLLNAAERAAAPVLARTLRVVCAAIGDGHLDAAQLGREGRQLLAAEPLLRLDYFEIVDPDSLQPVDRIQGPVRIAVAAYFGSTRLIDNVAAHPPQAR